MTEQQIKIAVGELLSRMTTEEKLGQMTQAAGADLTAIGTPVEGEPPEGLIRRGLVGSMIQAAPPKEMAAAIREYQRIAVEESRLGIPLLFCQDVIHGFETVFPIPLAWSCSFDPAAIEMAAAISAVEAGCCGIGLAFAPMVDLVRDPRWGRVAESAGEDPYWGGEVARALVRGLQGAGVAACLKHFVGYGGAEGGRDYNTVELSETTLKNAYLPPFREGIAAGAASVMTAFQVMDGVPAVANRHLLQDILRRDLGFDGVVISDYAAVAELEVHGTAADGADAARQAALAGLDIEMATSCLRQHLPRLVAEGVVPEEVVNRATARILTLKYRLGLFEDPYRFLREEEIDRVVFCAEHRAYARELGAASAVLLKNDGVLPLKAGASIALIGPFGDSTDLCGCWSFSTRRHETPTIAEGLREQGFRVTVEAGCHPLEEIDGGIARALSAAAEAEVVVLALGETAVLSGEACSRQNITIPAPQQRLAEAVMAAGRPTVVVLTGGRPLLLDWYDTHANAILEVWAPGSEGGRVVADLLSGAEEPTGRLTMSFPRHTGQIPVYYNALPTGRPYVAGLNDPFRSYYLDGSNDPLYPFGYGLGYTAFALTDLTLSGERMRQGECLTATARLENTGQRAGKTVVQLYLRDCVAAISRPVKELKGVQKVGLQPGEVQQVRFAITEEMLRFYHPDGAYAAEPGRFEVMVGLSSAPDGLLRGEFTLGA